MSCRALTIAFVAGLLALPAFSQETQAPGQIPAQPPILLPAPAQSAPAQSVPAQSGADLPSPPPTVRPAGGSGCSHDKAVTS